MLGCSSIRGFCEEDQGVCSARQQKGRFLQGRRLDAKNVSDRPRKGITGGPTLSTNPELLMLTCINVSCFANLTMTIPTAHSCSAPSQGWTSAYRDLRALKASDPEIPMAFASQAYGLNLQQCCFLFEAYQQDSNGLLLDLSEEQFELIHTNGFGCQGKLIARVVAAIRHGLASYINDEWAYAVGFSDESEETSLEILRLRAEQIKLRQELDTTKQTIKYMYLAKDAVDLAKPNLPTATNKHNSAESENSKSLEASPE